MGLMEFWISALGLMAGLILASRRLMHYFQLESYQFQGYMKTVRRQWKKALAPCWGLAAGFGALGWIAQGIGGGEAAGSTLALIVSLLLAVAYALGGWLMRKILLRASEKKRFSLTARMKRLYAIHGLTLFALSSLLTLVGKLSLWLTGTVLAVALPVVVMLSAVLALPIERGIFFLYFHDAEKKLLENDRLIRIGITGSYGKTSTKFVLATILSQKYNVLATPASFNTPMGVTRIIRERLQPSHQVFIGEMGARHVGEIKELCRLVHPQIGLLTAVGPQHLDTFKTLERIEKTKYELIEALPSDGFGAFLDDGAIVTRLYNQTQDKEKMLVGPEGSAAWATEIRVSASGSHFLLHLGDWQPIPCETKLLGAHNIRNILLSCAVAKRLGLTREEIARGVAALQPVEHRLQLLRSAGGITVIDDAFNTNPRSSKAALDVLGSFTGRRVIVTPGMVELGKDEEKYNREFGEYMAGKTDIAVLVGKKHTRPILEGLLAKGFSRENVHTVSSLNEAVAIANQFLRPGDVVMYENDLPDHYSEG